MGSNYRIGTLYLYTLEPSENREPEKITTVEEKNSDLDIWNYILNKYISNLGKFKLVKLEDNLISNFFYNFLLSKESKFKSCLSKVYNFNNFKFNNSIYDIYEFHILLLKIYFFLYCLKIITEDSSDKNKNKNKSNNDPTRQENRVTLVEQYDETIEQSLNTPDLQPVLLEFSNILNKEKEKEVIGGRKNKRKKYTGNGDGTEEINVDIYKLVDSIVNENNVEEKYKKIIDMCICKDLFTCKITSTGGNRINKIHKSLKELKTYAKKINITCSNKNKSELFKAIKQINLNNLKIDELKEYCKFFNIKGYSKYKNKKSLIKFINEHNI